MNKLLRASENPNGQVINGRKRLIFNLVLFIITLLFLFIIEFGLRIFNYGNDLSLFVKSVNYSGYYEINGKVNLRYFSKFERTSSTSDIFLIEKPDTCFRIFVFGESTARGFPYQAGNSFPNILYYRLQDAFPDKRIEVINLSASAINSYSYIDMLGEVLDQKPDLILLYGGHNEYYGALGVGSVEGGGNVRWIKKLRLKLCKLRSFQLVQNSIMKGSMILSKNDQGDDGTLMSRIAKDKDILINSPQFNAGIEQFSKNISELVQKAHKKNIPVVMSELVNNIKDQEPFKSAGTPSAIDVFNEAKRLEAEGKVKEAKELYYQAKDLDVIRFRSPERINEVIQSICKQNNLPLVPMKRVFEMESPNQLIGNNLIIEHLHPNIDGYFLMADAFFNTLRENKLISKNWNAAKIKPSLYYRNHWGFTELDSLLGELNIKSLKAGWPYRTENQLKTFVQTYRPESYVDSVAFAYLTGDYETRHIEDEHIKVAQHYFKLGLNDKAFKEYLALIKLHPYIADLYFDASKYLIAQQKFSEALELINSAPLMEKNFFYYYMIGTLKLKIGYTQTAISNLEHAFKIITPVDKPEKVLMPLYVAYKESGDTENQKRVMGLIKQSIPELGKESMLEKAKPAAPAVSANEMIAMAESLLKKREFEKAKELLFSANKIEETAKADKLIGMIFFTQKENKLAYTYSLKAYQLDQNDFENNNNLYILCLLNDDLKNASLVLEKLRSMNIEPSKIQRLENLYDKKKKELESN